MKKLRDIFQIRKQSTIGVGGNLSEKKKKNLSMSIQLLMAKSKQIFIPNYIHFLVFSFVTPVI